MKTTKDRTIDAVMRNVFASREAMERLEADLRAHFADGAATGESEEAVASRIGPPEEVAASFMEGVELEPAGFWIRTFAFAADLGLCMTLVIPFLGAAIPLVAYFDGEPPLVVAAAVIPAAVAAFGVLLGYFPVFEARFGWTPGKRLLGLRVIGESNADISVGQAIVRRLPYYFEILALDALFIPFTKKKQRAFDLVARTLVVREPDGDRAAWRWLACALPWLPPAAFVAAAAAMAG